MKDWNKDYWFEQIFVGCRSLIFILESADSLSPAPPGGAEGLGERAEAGLGGRLLVRELWFVAVMTAVALLLLAVILGVVLYKVRDLKTASSRSKLCWKCFVCCRS